MLHPYWLKRGNSMRPTAIDRLIRDLSCLLPISEFDFTEINSLSERFKEVFSAPQDTDELLRLLRAVIREQNKALHDKLLPWIVTAPESKPNLKRLSQEKPIDLLRFLANMGLAWEKEIGDDTGECYTALGWLFANDENLSILQSLANTNATELLHFFIRIPYAAWRHYPANGSDAPCLLLFSREAAQTLLNILAKQNSNFLIHFFEARGTFWGPQASKANAGATTVYFLVSTETNMETLHLLSQKNPKALLELLHQFLPNGIWAQEKRAGQHQGATPLSFLVSAERNQQTLNNLARHDPAGLLQFLHIIPSGAWAQGMQNFRNVSPLHDLVSQKTNQETLMVLAQKEPARLLAFFKKITLAWNQAIPQNEELGGITPLHYLFSLEPNQIILQQFASQCPEEFLMFLQQIAPPTWCYTQTTESLTDATPLYWLLSGKTTQPIVTSLAERYPEETLALFNKIPVVAWNQPTRVNDDVTTPIDCLLQNNSITTALATRKQSFDAFKRRFPFQTTCVNNPRELNSWIEDTILRQEEDAYSSYDPQLFPKSSKHCGKKERVPQENVGSDDCSKRPAPDRSS